MALDIAATGLVALSLSTLALQLSPFLGTAAPPAPPSPGALPGALHALLALAAMGGLVTAAAFMYAGTRVRAAAGDRRRLAGLVSFLLCASAGVLEFLLFLRPAGGDALGAAAVHCLPAAAAATFSMGMALIYAHFGNGPVPSHAVQFVAKITIGAAAALACIMAMAMAGAGFIQ